MPNQDSFDVLDQFHPVIAQWFRQRFQAPTSAQVHGWPAISAGRNTLIAAPTGSGKTLAAFLVCINRLLRRWEDGELEDRPYVVYVSPLKALSNDIQRNLEGPLSEIRERTRTRAGEMLPVSAAVRTGDTPQHERQRMLRRPPHILVTTPESLYLLLTSERGRAMLSNVESVIVDEIHALARDKRGSHLSLTLARLNALGPRPPVRIGLSATQRPIDEIARYLVGTNSVAPDGTADCQVIDVGHMRELDLAIEVPKRDLEAVCSHEHWDEVYDRLVELIGQHRSTLIFVNTRRLAERIAHRMAERLGPDAVASHHGSLSRQIRLNVEQRLKSGVLKAIVATASLEMGIDVGAIELVCQVGSPRAIATFLQRVGRSGHTVGETPRGRLFPLTRDELLECLALVSAVRCGRLDAIEVPQGPLDILAQQIVAEVASRDCGEDELYQRFRSAWPYRHLSRSEFDAVIHVLSEGITPTNRRGRQLHHDRIHRRLRARRGARLAALTSGGAIPESAQFRVVTVEDGTYVGDVDEDFAIESSSGDIFLLGNNSWQIARILEGQVLVHDAHGAPPTVPFWFGEAPGRTKELSGEVSRLRQQIQDRLPVDGFDEDSNPAEDILTVTRWLTEQCGCSVSAGRQVCEYVAAQTSAVGFVPTSRRILFERFFDESGGMQLVIHAPFGSRINRAWGLALRKRFCRSFDFELQAAATDDGIVLSLGPQHSFPVESLFRIVHPDNGRYLLEQAILAIPMFQIRWRWNVTRALIVPRFRGGKKVPFYLQRYRSDDLLAAVFPETVGCLENHEGDVEIPDHPLVRQTVLDCLHEAMDLNGWIDVLDAIRRDEIELVARDTREPSPFSHQLLNANPYAFLDGAPLEERRTRAIVTRKGLPLDQLRNLALLDPAAIDQCVREAAPPNRDPDELHEWLHESVVVLEEDAPNEPASIPRLTPSDPFLAELIASQRVFSFRTSSGNRAWAATERWPFVRAIYPDAQAATSVTSLLPDPCEPSAADALKELLRGWVGRSGPITASSLARVLGLAKDRIFAALEAIEGTGGVMRGHYRRDSSLTADAEEASDVAEIQWCDRSLLARIHRLTLEQLRSQVQPVDRATFVRFCFDHQHFAGNDSWGGPAAVREVVGMLQGMEGPAAAWESCILPARIHEYDPQWLDQLFATGELMWGRLRTPRIDSADRNWSHQLTRSIPIGLVLREDLDWLLPPGPRIDVNRLRSDAQVVYETLSSRGALFWQQLLNLTGLLNAQLEVAMRELAAVGLVTCDSFEAVRQLIARPVRRRRSAKRRMGSIPGRWSTFGGTSPPPSEDVLVRWARQLLRRWGVVFRDLLAREPAAPAWIELVKVFRQMEYRGETRGGRFIGGVAGVQFAMPQAVTALRGRRDHQGDSRWHVISAADPLNVVGILDQGEDRIPSIAGNALVFRNGQCLAWKVGDSIQCAESVPAHESQRLIRAMEEVALPGGRRAIR